MCLLKQALAEFLRRPLCTSSPASTPRFRQVRSGVKEAAGWGVVTLCTHVHALSRSAQAQAAERLAKIIDIDDNVIVVGLALDALLRLAALTTHASAETNGEERRQHAPIIRTRWLAARALAMGQPGRWLNHESLSQSLPQSWQSALHWGEQA